MTSSGAARCRGLGGGDGRARNLAVDQCVLVEGRFTLLAPDAYRGDTLDVKLFDRRGKQVASESLYTDDDEDDDELDVD